MIALTWDELMALTEARGTPPGIKTAHDPATNRFVLDEAEWAKYGNGPLPTAKEISDAVAGYVPPAAARDALAEIDAMKAKVDALERLR